MGWKTKGTVLAIASRTPGGRRLYQHIQDRQASRMADADEMLARGIDLLSLFRTVAGTTAARDFVEVGTGWCPWVPLMLRLTGAGRITTVDVNPWLSQRTAVGTTRALRERAGAVASAFGLSEDGIRRQLAAAAAARTLEDWLSVTRIEYQAEGGLHAARLPSGSVDGVISSNVLEHVPPQALKDLHEESFRVLRHGGLIAHRFNPQDHYSEADRSITVANFLQFSEEEWDWWGGSGLAYHNRLRCPQHAQLITDAGFVVAYSRTRSNSRAHCAIESGQLRVHPDFAGMSPRDLSDDYMWVVAQRPAAERVAAGA